MKPIFLLPVLAVSFCSNIVVAKEDALTVTEIKSRFEVRGEVYFLDSDGKKVLEKGSQSRIWKPRVFDGKAEIDHQWSSGSIQNGEFALHHIWTVQDDGTIRVKVEEYGKVEDKKKSNGEHDVQFSELLKKDERVLENFSPISWVSARPNAKHRVLIRFIPQISDEDQPKKITELPISGTDIMITDNEGSVWTEHNNVSGKYVGFTTHRGSLFLSFYPFRGASEMGYASGNKIELQLGGKRVATLTSQSPFLPNDVRGIVYGYYRADQKTHRLSSTHTRTSNQENRFLDSIRKGERH